MPSSPTTVQEQGFRSSLFGFDKNDVLAYMNVLANEGQQRELEHQEQLQKLEDQLDSMRKEQANARAHIEALQAEIAAANQRAENAEQQQKDSAETMAAMDQRVASYQSSQKESQKNANIWQLKCHDLQQQIETLQQQLQAQPKAPPPADATREARAEARRILSDARLYAETAEREMKQQAETQKTRMAENARGIASGVMLLRERLRRVDERIGAATLDLDHVTQGIYQALDETEEGLKALGTDMRVFAQGSPELTPAAPPTPAQPPVPVRPKAGGSQPAQRPRRVVAKPLPPQPAKPSHRLRTVQRPVTQLLDEQLERLKD